MALNLYIKDGEALKHLKVPSYVVKDLLRDRLSNSELARINRFAEDVKIPDTFKPKSVLVDFAAKKAQCFQAGLNLTDLEPTWDVKAEEMTLMNY